jgi:hypothetical protein
MLMPPMSRTIPSQTPLCERIAPHMDNGNFMVIFMVIHARTERPPSTETDARGEFRFADLQYANTSSRLNRSFLRRMAQRANAFRLRRITPGLSIQPRRPPFV